MGFGGVGLIYDLWLWVCFVVFYGFVLWWLWVCWWWLCCVGVGLCFFFFGSATRVCGCGWWADGGVGVCGSVEVGFGSVGGGMGLLPGFFFFFLVLTVDYGLLVVVVVVVVSGVCSAAVVVIVVVEQK